MCYQNRTSSKATDSCRTHQRRPSASCSMASTCSGRTMRASRLHRQTQSSARIAAGPTRSALPGPMCGPASRINRRGAGSRAGCRSSFKTSAARRASSTSRAAPERSNSGPDLIAHARMPRDNHGGFPHLGCRAADRSQPNRTVGASHQPRRVDPSNPTGSCGSC